MTRKAVVDGDPIMFPRLPIFDICPGYADVGSCWELVATSLNSRCLSQLYFVIFALFALASCAQISPVFSPATSPENGGARLKGRQSPLPRFNSFFARWGDGLRSALRASCCLAVGSTRHLLWEMPTFLSRTAHHWQAVPDGRAARRNVSPAAARRFLKIGFQHIR